MRAREQADGWVGRTRRLVSRHRGRIIALIGAGTLGTVLVCPALSEALQLPLTAASPSYPGNTFPGPTLPPVSAPCPLPNAGTGDGSPSNPGVGACAVVPPPYPDFGPYGSPQAVNQAAQQWSDKLRDYIIGWFHGKEPATVPPSLLPSGMEAGIGPFTLLRPNQVDPAKQWLVRPAHYLSPTSEKGFYPDPAVTYLIQPALVAPFGTRITMTGKFPHARFFDVQVSPPFDPFVYYYGGSTGAGAQEVPIADVDIQPDPGSVNPFLPGANRAAPNRSYTLTINSTIGDPLQLNPAFKPPFRHTQHNTLNGGGFEYVGPGGCDKAYQPLSKGRGCFSGGNLWVRYYLPDHMDALGGVPLPKLLYSLHFDAAWHQFYLQGDISKITAFANQDAQIKGPGIIQPGNPRPDTEGSSVGWFPEYGVLRTIAESLSRALLSVSSPLSPVGADYARSYDKGFDSHGEDVPGIGSYEHGATEADYVNYLTRTMNRSPGDVVVVTGRMPRIPKTLGGEASMTRGQMRYWSLTSYPSLFTYPGVQPGTIPGQTQATTDNWPGVPVTSLFDEQVKTDAQGRYVIVYSTPADRPANATESNGVTWVDWGPVGDESFTLRMLSVRPDWSFCRTPDELSIGWRGDWAATAYDPALFSANNSQGFLGDYQPVFHYMTKAGFEALGNGPITPDKIPAWTGGSSPTDTGPPTPPGPTNCLGGSGSGSGSGAVSAGGVSVDPGAASGSGDIIRVNDPTGYFSGPNGNGYIAVHSNGDGSYQAGACSRANPEGYYHLDLPDPTKSGAGGSCPGDAR